VVEVDHIQASVCLLSAIFFLFVFVFFFLFVKPGICHTCRLARSEA